MACSPESDGDLFSPGSGGKGDGEDLHTTLPAGHYALELMSRSEVWDGAERRMLYPSTRVLALARVIRDGKAQALRVAPCRVELPQLGKYLPRLPDSTVQRLPALELPIAIDAVGTEQEAAWRLSSGLRAITLGAQLDDPLDDPLPAHRDDPAVIDQDGDGEPGITVKVALFSVYLAARVRLQLLDGRYPRQSPSDDAGVEVERPTIDGKLSMTLDQRIYGDSVPFYDVAEAVAEAGDTYRILSTEQHFALSPITARSCAALLAR